MQILARIGIPLVLAAASLAANAPGAGAAGLGRVVVLGDSTGAGYLNSSLLETQQSHGYASVVVAQDGGYLPLPLIEAPGVPSVLRLKRGTGEISRAPGVSNGRIDPLVQTFNLAVPGARLSDALRTRPDFPIDDLTDLVLGLPGLLLSISYSQVEWAEALQPDTAFVWLGSQDILVGVINGTDTAIVDTSDFAADYAGTDAKPGILARLAAIGSEPRLAVGNVPDVTTIPFMFPAPALIFIFSDPGILAFLELDFTDFVTLDALGPIAESLAAGNNVPFTDRDPATCFPSADPTTCDYVLTAAEVAAIQVKVTEFNAIIDGAVEDLRLAGHEVALVNLHDFLDAVAFGPNDSYGAEDGIQDGGGIVVDGELLTADFLGGTTSLDGIHATFTAQALIADEFIKAINAEAGAELVAPLSAQRIRAVLRSDRLVFHDPASPPPPLGPMFSLEAGDSVSGLTSP